MPDILAALIAAALTALVLRITHKVMLRDGAALALSAYAVLVLVKAIGG